MGGEEVEEVEVTSLQVDIGPEVAMVDRCRPDPRSRSRARVSSSIDRTKSARKPPDVRLMTCLLR
jgi:hypothetical protein